MDRTNAFFLGLVLSVTAVSVVAKLLIEREALRRDYAQVMLAAGIAGEVIVWPLISIVSSVQHKANAVSAGFKASAWRLFSLSSCLRPGGALRTGPCAG